MDRIKPSDFRMPVVFQQSVDGVETRYGKEITWVEVYSDRGKLEVIKSERSARLRGELPNPVKTHILTIRFRSDFSEYHRVCMNDLYYKIISSESVDNGRDTYIEMYLDEEKPDIT